MYVVYDFESCIERKKKEKIVLAVGHISDLVNSNCIVKRLDFTVT